MPDTVRIDQVIDLVAQAEAANGQPTNTALSIALIAITHLAQTLEDLQEQIIDLEGRIQ